MYYGLLCMNLQMDYGPHGIMYEGGDGELADRIEAYIRDQGVNYRRKYLIVDWHPTNQERQVAMIEQPHITLLPPHCVHDTAGAQHLPPIERLLDPANTLVNGIYRKGQLAMGDGRSAFEAITAADSYVLDARMRYFGMERFDLVGMDVPSVLLSAFHGRALGYGVRILADLCSPLAPQQLSECAKYEVEVINSDQAWIAVNA